MSPRIGIVGWGKIAPKHAEVLRALGADVVAVASRSEAGRSAALANGVENVFSDVRAMLDANGGAGIDGVVVCPAFPGVFDVAATVIERGMPALVEKPPGTSLAELDMLIELQSRSGSPVVVGLNRRHYSTIASAIDHAGGHENIDGVFVEWSEDPKHVLKRHSSDEVRRWIFGNTLHGLDLMTWLGGPCPAVATIGRRLNEPFDWQMAAQGFSARGALVSFTSTWNAPGKWRVSFTAQGRRYVCAPLESCTVISREGEQAIAVGDDDCRFKPGFLAQARVFLKSMQDGLNETHSLLSVRPAMELAERMTYACSGQPSCVA